MPGKKFEETDLDPADHCPTCGVKLTEKEKNAERCRNGHALSS